MSPEILAWIGSVAFGFCGVPQAIKTLQTGRAEDFSSVFLFLWMLGEVCMMAYSLMIWNSPLIVNYVLNMCCLLPIVWYKIFPRQVYQRS